MWNLYSVIVIFIYLVSFYLDMHSDYNSKKES